MSCMDFDEKRPIIVTTDAQGGKVIHQINNPKRFRFRRYRIDGCVFRDGRKCDYALIDLSNQVAYLVELKGSDLDHAISQIENTYRQLPRKCRAKKFEFHIVLSKVKSPDLYSSTYKKFILDCKRRGIGQRKESQKMIVNL